MIHDVINNENPEWMMIHQMDWCYAHMYEKTITESDFSGEISFSVLSWEKHHSVFVKK